MAGYFFAQSDTPDLGGKNQKPTQTFPKYGGVIQKTKKIRQHKLLADAGWMRDGGLDAWWCVICGLIGVLN
jgi:hypothetical protein